VKKKDEGGRMKEISRLRLSIFKKSKSGESRQT